MTEILALIPARSGSKNPPNKNIKLFKGKPLFCRSIDHAKKSKLISRCVVSTDSRKYAEIAKKHGAEVPFLRPKKFAGDLSTDLEVFKHALGWLKENEGYVPDLIVHLRPTSPIRDPKMIDKAITMMIKHPEADSLRSVILAKNTPFKMWMVKGEHLVPLLKLKGLKEPYNSPRQILPKVYWQNACIDIVRPTAILTKNSMTGDKILSFIMDDFYDVDIDTKEDLKQGERKNGK